MRQKRLFLAPLLALTLFAARPARAELGWLGRTLSACGRALGLLEAPSPAPAHEVEKPPPAPVAKRITLTGPATLLPNLPKEFQDRVQMLHGKPFDPTLVTGHWSRPMWGGLKTTDLEGKLKLYYAKELAADIDIYYRKGVLRFDIDIYKPFRGTKLYEYLLAQALKECPPVESIPARFYERNSDNAKVLVRNVFGSPEAFAKFPGKTLSPDEVKELRQKIYDSLYLMPGMKARERNGYGRVTKVIFHPGSLGIAFIAEKGPRGPPDELKIYLDKKNPWELNPDGSFARVGHEALSLGDYVELQPWN